MPVTPEAPSAVRLAAARDRLRERAAAGAVRGYPGEHAHLVDTYFAERLVEIRPLAEFLQDSAFALVAVGGYGRRELCPGSDVDVLVVFERRIPAEAAAVCRHFFFPLWDLGYDLGQGVRTVADCLELARDDVQVLCSLIDARPVCGGLHVFEALERRFRDKVLSRRLLPLADALGEANARREAAAGDAAVLLEPDLKAGLGGLRDAHQVFWLTRALAAQGTAPAPFLPEDLAALRHDQETVLAARTALHLAAGRHTDRLYFDLQPRVAELLGYAAADDTALARGRNVEFFLTRLHEATSRIKAMRRAAFVHLETLRSDAAPHPAGENLLDGPGGLRFASQSAAGPAHALGLFRAMAASGRPLAWSAWRFIRDRGRTWGATLRSGPTLSAALPDLARAPHAEAALAALLETGLLGAAVPEFGRVQHLVQFDDVHVHPVGPHTLRTMIVLASFLDGAGGWAADIARRLRRPERVLLAAFFHDLGKEYPDHAAVGAELARRVLIRWDAGEACAEEVAFLVREHLRIPATATGSDLGDESVVARVAAACGTPERLDALYLLSVADSMATGPRTFNDWIASLFAELYFKARNLLEQGDLAGPDAASSLAVRLEAVELLARRRFGPEGARECLDRVPARMVQVLPPEDVADAYALVRRTEEALALDAVRRPGHMAGLGVCELTVRRSRAAGFLELTLAARDRPGLFAAEAGVLSLQNLDILAVEVFTWKGGLAVNRFTVSEPRDREFADEFWGRVRAMLGGTFTGRLDVAHHLAQRRASPLAAGRCGPKLPAEVRVDNAASDFYTKVSVAAPDRLGLLHDLAARLTALGADIQLARIATRSGLVADVFYVRGADGRKITDEAAVARLETGLFEAACG